MHSSVGLLHSCSLTGQPGRRTRRQHRHCARALPAVAAQYATLPAQEQPLLQPVSRSARAFAPATVANLGPGFDWMGCAVEVSCSTSNCAIFSAAYKRMKLMRSLLVQGEGDIVLAEAEPDLPAGDVVIRNITGDEGRLSRLAAENCAGIAALETLALLGTVSCGVALSLHKVNSAF